MHASDMDPSRPSACGTPPPSALDSGRKSALGVSLFDHVIDSGSVGASDGVFAGSVLELEAIRFHRPDRDASTYYGLELGSRQRRTSRRGQAAPSAGGSFDSHALSVAKPVAHVRGRIGQLGINEIRAPVAAFTKTAMNASGYS
jgi:hypothetical protein